MSASEAETPGQRADLWLFRARFTKSRGLAAKLIETGGLRVERFGAVQRVSRASFLIRPGDVLVIARRALPERVTVLALAERRGPAKQAATLYRRAEDENGDE